MALWRFGSGWTQETLRKYRASFEKRPVNFDVPLDQITKENGWTTDGVHSIIGREAPGPPVENGFFQRCREALINYEFSDPNIVQGHFDPQSEFVGRTMLLEIKVWGFHFLSGVRVHSVRDEIHADNTIFGFRYDTLEGHIERGFEWFLLEKNHASGEVTFQIEARWRLGDFPNWWSKIGFKLIGEHYRERWRHAALERLAKLPGDSPGREYSQND
jgi:uncharacterized protein (UPF0548 family)